MRMFVAAMLAPALLAVGLLVGELTGYGDSLRGSLAVAARQPPPPPKSNDDHPARPDLLYQALVPLYQGIVPPPLIRKPHRPLSPERPVKPVRKVSPRSRHQPPTRRAEPKAQEFSCAREWQNTWLWELCQERMRRTT
ncbi:hypothetical protein [Microtetraspora sp. NBRC 16547]|uniref:hypothetical protein n=1 Tax=Microtetraspora sp. NBRC 16547 TaxID=3030993 RepID=UPI0024A1A165|nr:hypothetical protein [Microtetraspora sp. NBRC 16547]GLX02182.1 hypothetical protein Misp02_62680 [Microtetraspora sp. NBRC 16547]